MKTSVCLVLACFWGSFHVGEALAQRITLIAPTQGPLTIASAEEFSTDVARSIWNMDELRDIPFENGVLQPSVTNGIWSAATEQAGAGAGVYLLNGGIPNPPHSFHPTEVSGMTPYGGLNPIDTSRFRKLSLRMGLDQAERGSVYVTWSSDPDVMPSDLGNTAVVGTAGAYDHRPTFTADYQLTSVNYPSGFKLYDIDLTPDFDTSEYVSWLSYPPIYPAGKAWSGDMYALMTIPSTESQVGSTVQLDWARLYDPDTATDLTITWDSAGIPADIYHAVALYIDNDTSSFDGDLYASGIVDDGQFIFNTGALPPGDYYLYLEVLEHFNSGFNVVARSGYSSRITIGEPPQFTFTSPTATSGVDYATTELGNPWDMADSSDIAQSYDLLNPVFQDGQLHAAVPGLTDAMLFLNTERDGTTVPIDTTKYRYLSYRLEADHSQGDALFTRMIRGWVTKLTWWDTDLLVDGTYSRDLHLYEGMRAYTMDLFDNDLANPNYDYDAGWEEIGQATVFRIDPLESDVDVNFILDDVKLCAENEPTGGNFTIAWNCQDGDDTNITVSLYYGYFSDLGYQEEPTPIASRQQTSGPNQFTWDTFGLPTGDYYIRAEVTDGLHTQSVMSPVPIVIDTGIPRMNVSGMDPTVFDTSDGYWYILYANGGAEAIQWGWPSVEPVSGDYDGDGIDDLAVFDQATGRWFIRSVAGATIAWEVFWGWPGVRPVPGDYNGNGTNDLAILDQNTGRWFIQTVGREELAWSVFWGWPGVDPVPGDYDGDGIDDLAIFDQNTGRWFIRKLSGDIILWEAFWGWPGVTPVPGDYNNDGIDDLAIFDQNTGRWFIREVDGTVLAWEEWWGFAGCTPVPGDYDNDGIADKVAYYESNGLWYFRFSGGGPDDAAGPWRGTGTIPVSGNFDGLP